MWKEFAGFLSARLFSLLVDMGLMYLFVSAMGMREMIAKFIVQIVIVIINYVFSKLFIFRKQKKLAQLPHMEIDSALCSCYNRSVSFIILYLLWG